MTTYFGHNEHWAQFEHSFRAHGVLKLCPWVQFEHKVKPCALKLTLT